MKIYDIWIKPGNIIFAPKNEVEEVLQNVITICSTPVFSVPMDRDFGVNAVFVDDPVSTAKSKIASEYITAVRKFETRARITKVLFEGDLDGKIYPHIFVKILL